MSRQDANAAFAHTSFLYGGNAAYIEDLYAKYEADPSNVDAEWRDFFQSLKDERSAVVKSAQGASWKKPNWPLRPDGDLVAALDTNWAETEKKLGEKIAAKVSRGKLDLGLRLDRDLAAGAVHLDGDLQAVRADQRLVLLVEDFEDRRLGGFVLRQVERFGHDGSFAGMVGNCQCPSPPPREGRASRGRCSEVGVSPGIRSRRPPPGRGRFPAWWTAC